MKILVYNVAVVAIAEAWRASDVTSAKDYSDSLDVVIAAFGIGLEVITNPSSSLAFPSFSCPLHQDSPQVACLAIQTY